MDTKQVKSVAEHWACSELARRGWAPALTRDDMARTDILAVSTLLPGRPTIQVQVKSATKSTKRNRVSWHLGKSTSALDESDSAWFVLVVVPEIPAPLYGFVIPRDHVAAATYLNHQSVFTGAGRTPDHPDVELDRMRISETVFEAYQDRWDLLDSPTSEVPIMLPKPLLELIDDQRIRSPERPWAPQGPA